MFVFNFGVGSLEQSVKLGRLVIFFRFPWQFNGFSFAVTSQVLKKVWVGHFHKPLNCTRNKLPFPHHLISHSWFSHQFFPQTAKGAKFGSREDFKFEVNCITVYETKYHKGCFYMWHLDTKETVCHRPSIMMMLETTKYLT